MSTFAIYLIGFLLFVSGLAYGAYMLGVSPAWIGVGAITLIGFGMVVGVGKTRQKDQTPTSE